MQELLSYFEVQDLTWNIAKRAGELYRNGTHHMEFPDYIIAATALISGAQVVTLNRKHFSQIPDLQLFDERKILS
jgi:predicted nucleic acid-binding protein